MIDSEHDEPGKEQRLLTHARREGLFIMVVWAAALAWTVGSSYAWGQGRDPATVRLIAGMPDWVFWSVALPWVALIPFTGWFCFRYMADDDLGQDPEGGPADD
jgi:hypothetical protein